MKRSFLLACALVCLYSVPAFAQTHRPPSGPASGGYVAGIGGVTVGGESDKVYGGELGVDASRNATVYGSLGRMQNISKSNDLTGAGLTAKSPATFGVGGVKYRVPTNSSVRPYVLGGAGVGSIKSVDALGLNQKETKPMVEMGGGVEIPVGPMYVDTGYRFGKFVGLDDGNISRAYAGVGYRFGRTK